MGISRYLLAGTILLTIPFFASLASADEVIERRGELIGRWCDMSIASMPEYDYIIEIWKLEAGKYSYHQLFKSKDPDQPSINSYAANKINQTWRVQNDLGEYVRVGDGGFLRLYDGQGFIRKAKPVGKTTKPGKCRNSSN